MKFISTFLILSFFFMHKVAAFDEASLIFDRHRVFLLKTILTDKNKILEKTKLFNKESGRYSDINYKDNNPGSWQTAKHLDYTRDLALLWCRIDNKEEKKLILSIIISSLDNWHHYQYKSSNWWYNEIGVPQLMKDILVLLKESLTPNQLHRYLEIVNQYKINGQGANLIWSADIALFYGLFTQNRDLVASALKHILYEVKVSKNEGLKPDYSFHQHGARLQLYHYGRIFLIENLRLAWELKDTKWAYPYEKIMLLNSMLINGWHWMSRGVNTVPETMDRASSRINALKNSDIRVYIPFFMELLPNFKRHFFKILSDQDKNESSLRGVKGFPYSDFAAFHNDEYSCFIKTISTRTLPSESINNENLKGKLLNSGETYFVRDGTEYFNLMSVWNWKMLPGITAFDSAEAIQRKEFSGIVSDNSVGVISMDYKMVGNYENRYFSCNKSWFLLNGFMICLMSDIHVENINKAYTVLDQCRLKSCIITQNDTLKNGSYAGLKDKWIMHNGFAYLPLYKEDGINLFAGIVNGDWHDINHSYQSKAITDSVFMPSLEHGIKTRRSGYAVFFSTNVGEVNNFNKAPPYKILKNENYCQAVLLHDKSLLACFFKNGSLKFGSKKLSVNGRCLVILSKNKMYLSDPLHQGKTIQIKYKNKTYIVNLPKDGSTKEILL